MWAKAIHSANRTPGKVASVFIATVCMCQKRLNNQQRSRVQSEQGLSASMMDSGWYLECSFEVPVPEMKAFFFMDCLGCAALKATKTHRLHDTKLQN